MEAGEVLKGGSRDSTLSKKALKGGGHDAGANVIAYDGAKARGILKYATESGLQSILEFGGRGIGFVDEIIIGLDIGFPCGVEDNRDIEEGNGLDVIVGGPGVVVRGCGGSLSVDANCREGAQRRDQ